MRLIVILFLAILATGCITRNAQVVNFETGEVLKAKFTDSMGTNGKATVTMPNGEILTGPYSAIRGNDSITFGSSFTSNGSSSLYSFGNSRTVGGAGRARAILTSTTPGSRLAMEIIVAYGVLDGHGFGEAQTNDGRKYKVQF